MARTDPQVNLRIPAELKEALDATAEDNKRSLTAEIVATLERAIRTPAGPDLEYLLASIQYDLASARTNTIIVKRRLTEMAEEVMALLVQLEGGSTHERDELVRSLGAKAAHAMSKHQTSAEEVDQALEIAYRAGIGVVTVADRAATAQATPTLKSSTPTQSAKPRTTRK